MFASSSVVSTLHGAAVLKCHETRTSFSCSKDFIWNLINIVNCRKQDSGLLIVHIPEMQVYTMIDESLYVHTNTLVNINMHEQYDAG